MRSRRLDLMMAELAITETNHPTDRLSPTATNHVYIVDVPDMQETAFPHRFKSKCKKHRREARGW
jgi:hypothetical protein